MRILSGIQPSGALHLGNYFGMMRPAIELQDKGDAYYFIANYHSMTSLLDPALRRSPVLAHGVNIWRGRIVHPAVAEALGEPATSLETLLG